MSPLGQDASATAGGFGSRDRPERPELALFVGDLVRLARLRDLDGLRRLGPGHPHLDPAREGLDLAVGELRLGGHLGLVLVANGRDDRALLRLPGDGRRPALAARQQGRARGQPQAPLGLLRRRGTPGSARRGGAGPPSRRTRPASAIPRRPRSRGGGDKQGGAWVFIGRLPGFAVGRDEYADLQRGAKTAYFDALRGGIRGRGGRQACRGTRSSSACRARELGEASGGLGALAAMQGDGLLDRLGAAVVEVGGGVAQAPQGRRPPLLDGRAGDPSGAFRGGGVGGLRGRKRRRSRCRPVAGSCRAGGGRCRAHRPDRASVCGSWRSRGRGRSISPP